MREMIVNELSGTLGGVDSGVLVDYQGLSAQELGDLRSKMRAEDLRVLVVKNSLLKLAFESGGITGIDEMLDGPVGIVWGGEDPSTAARTLADWNRKNKPVKIKGAFLEGGVISTAQVEALSRLPDRDTLRAMIAGLVVQPMQNIASLVNETVAQVARAVEALMKKKEE
jgi:large subunit ribosomal protein L10